MRAYASSDTLAIGLVFIGIAALACVSPVQSDTWWLLRAGQEIWTAHHVPLVDTYSHTAAGQYWPNHEWLTEAVFYALYATGGLPLLTLACAAAIVFAWRFAWRLSTGSFEAKFVSMVVALLSAAGAWAIRPPVFSMFLFAATVTALVKRRYVWVPVIVFVWANAHGAVALGLLAVGAAIAARLVCERRVPWDLCASGVASALATLATPLGSGLWTFIPASMAKSRVNQLIEWQPPGLTVAYLPFWLLAAVLAGAIVRHWKRLDVNAVTLAVIAMATLVLGARSVRNVSIFLLVAVPALTTVLASDQSKLPRRPVGERGLVNFVLLGVFGVAAAALVIVLWRMPIPPLGWQPISSRAVAAIRACDGPLYNTYDDGGVLIWFVPEKRVFVDNRQDPYPLDLLRDAYAVETGADYQRVFDTHGIQCAAVPSESPVTARLIADGWGETYRGARWAVLAKGKR